MKTVLIVGAGKSSACLIKYMLLNAKNTWKVVVMDNNLEALTEKIGGHPKGEAVVVDINDEEHRQEQVKRADIVLSLMPAHLHILLAKDCLKFGKNLITSSYITDEIRALNEEAKQKGLIFMCEMGLDPGIDHMSSCSIINGVHRIAGVITSFKSYCGGLVAPESDDNPWGYKISWNPKNVVESGRNGGMWLENGKEMTVGYDTIFENCKKIKVDNFDIGPFAYFPNRDSMKYYETYNLKEAKSFIRATLRQPHFTKAWHYLVKAGLTDNNDSFDADFSFLCDWVSHKTELPNNDQLMELFKAKYDVDDKSIKMIEWLGIFDKRQIHENRTFTSAEILQSVIEEKWFMRPFDKDMVVLIHQVEYKRKGMVCKLQSNLVVKGETRMHSAMAKTVGLPIGLLAKRILMTNEYDHLSGVLIPNMFEVYHPILKELEKYGIEFVEEIS